MITRLGGGGKMAKKDISLIAKFDELCRGFNYLISDSNEGKIIMWRVFIYIYMYMFLDNCI